VWCGGMGWFATSEEVVVAVVSLFDHSCFVLVVIVSLLKPYYHTITPTTTSTTTTADILQLIPTINCLLQSRVFDYTRLFKSSCCGGTNDTRFYTFNGFISLDVRCCPNHSQPLPTTPSQSQPTQTYLFVSSLTLQLVHHDTHERLDLDAQDTRPVRAARARGCLQLQRPGARAYRCIVFRADGTLGTGSIACCSRWCRRCQHGSFADAHRACATDARADRLVVSSLVALSTYTRGHVCRPCRLASSTLLVLTHSLTHSIVPSSDTVVVCGVDGMVYGLDTESGDTRWSFSTGRPLFASHSAAWRDAADFATRTTSAEEFANDMPPLFLPSADGSIYAMTHAGLNRLPITVRELVANSPFQSSDGTVYIGWKHTHVFAVDPMTGNVYQNFSTHVAGDDLGGLYHNTRPEANQLPPGTLFVGRADYSIRAIDLTGIERYLAHSATSALVCGSALLTA